MNCTHTTIVQAYGGEAVNTLCKVQGHSLPYTGLNLLVVLIVAAALTCAGVAFLSLGSGRP